MEIRDAVVLITGGGRGIGKAMARAFAAGGAKVAITSRSASQIEETANELAAARGCCIMGVPADVTNVDQVDDLVDNVTKSLGPIDVLVNNAGSHLAMGPTWEVDPKLWLTDINTNLYGTMLCCRAVIPGMSERRTGYILNMTGGGCHGPSPYASAYGASKLGLLGFTESLSRETAEYGITVFVMDPGFVRTEMTRHIITDPVGQRHFPFAQQMFDEEGGNPPELCAQLAVNLVSGQVDRLAGCYFHASDDFKAIVQNQEAILRDNLRRTRLRM